MLDSEVIQMKGIVPTFKGSSLEGVGKQIYKYKE